MGIADGDGDLTDGDALAGGRATLGVLVDVLVETLHVVHHGVFATEYIAHGGQNVVGSP
ncbi:hypothetical protein SDC9_175716 [bioreactor metagenome]|uniref:Uncharacterized protein n=1 Tax=bioreactor metagenome TaxID=1076179 RepID=A0A645GNH3_9ZZZZ